MYELKKMERYLRVKFVGTGPSSYEKKIYRTAVSQRLRNTAIEVRIGKKGTRGRRRKQLMDDLKEGILGTERSSITWHHVENWLWKRLWACPKTLRE